MLELSDAAAGTSLPEAPDTNSDSLPGTSGTPASISDACRREPAAQVTFYKLMLEICSAKASN